MAPTSEEQQLWVTRLLKKIQKGGFKASMMVDNGASMSMMMKPQEPHRSASQRSTGGPPSLTSSGREKSATLPGGNNSGKK
jgi:hypothetical protein